MKRKKLIVDSSALLARIKDEPGGETMWQIMTEARERGLYMHAVNVCEVAYQLIKFGFVEIFAHDLATPEGVEIITTVLPSVWKRAASLKAAHQNLSLGDCILIAQAEALNADILTGDRAFQLVDTTAKVLLFR